MGALMASVSGPASDSVHYYPVLAQRMQTIVVSQGPPECVTYVLRHF
jgi:hypothetical protein